MAKASRQPVQGLPSKQPGTPVYLSLVASIAADIAAGRLHAGDSLPPHREIAQRLGVSPGTAAKAYAEARRRGLVEGNRRGGTRVRHAGGLDRLRSTSQCINFASTTPNASSGPDLTAALMQVRRRQATTLMAYPPSEGHSHHRATGQSWLEMLGCASPDSHVFATVGAQHGVNLTLAALLQTGDTLATGSLCYPGVLAAAQYHGIQIAGVPHDDDGLDPNALDALCRHRQIRAVYCMPTAANPTGHTMSLHRKEAVARVAAQHGLIVIEDETHRSYAERPETPIVALLPEQTVLLTSLSKILLGGVRVGFAAMSSTMSEHFRRCLQADVLATSALDLDVITALIENGEAERVIARRRAEAGRRREIAARILAEVAVIPPHRDGPFLWFDVDDSESVATMAASRGVSVMPASAFAANGSYRDGIRVALSAPEDDVQVEHGLTLLRDMLIQMRSDRVSSRWVV